MSSSHRSAARLARKSFELSLAAPEVIAHRLTLGAIAGLSPSPAHRREFVRMGAEKWFAFHESWQAMNLALIEATLSYFSPWRWWQAPFDISRFTQPHHAHRRLLDVLNHGVTPVHRRAVANAARLRKNAARRARRK
jgi:hypothetical protein